MGLFGKSYDYKFGKESAQQEKMLQREQAFTQNMWNQTNDWNLAQWNRENEYNSAASQMERFALAGINPNNSAAAIAGNANAAGPLQADAMGSPSTPSAPSPVGTDLATSILGVGNTVLDSVMAGVNAYKTIKAEIPEAESRMGVNSATSENLSADTAQKNYETQHILPQTEQNLSADTQNKIQDTATKKAQEDEHRQKIDNLKTEKRLILQNIRKARRECKVLDKQVKYWEEMAKVAQSEEDKNYATAMAERANAALADKQGVLTDLQSDYQRVSNKENEENNAFRQKQRRQNLDPDEHNVATSVKKQAQMNSRDNKEADITNNLAKVGLTPVRNKEGNITHAKDANGRIVPLDKDGKPKGKYGKQGYRNSTNKSYNSGGVNRRNSNNHTNPVFRGSIPHFRR